MSIDRSFNGYCHMAGIRIALSNSTERKGLAMFNLLSEYKPELANALVGTEFDCFNIDDRINAFLAEVERRWDEFPSAPPEGG